MSLSQIQKLFLFIYLFGSVRQQNANFIHPTPIQFKRTFKRFFVRIMSSRTQNHRDDSDNISSKLSDCRGTFYDIITAPIQLKKAIGNCYPRNRMLVLKYFAGDLINKCLTKHCCQVCEEYSKAHQDLDESSLFYYYKAYVYDRWSNEYKSKI